MGGRNIGTPAFWTLLVPSRYDHPVLVHGNRNQPAPRALEDASRQPVPGFLHPNSAPISQENARRNFKGLLGTGNHHHLVGITADRPRRPQVIANGLTTTFRAPRISVVYRA